MSRFGNAFICACLLQAWSGTAVLGADWLVDSIAWPAQVALGDAGREIILGNGLIERRFATGGDLSTTTLVNLSDGTAFLAAPQPEAVVELEGIAYPVGGPATAIPGFQYRGYRTGAPEAPYPWKPARHAENRPWPPEGVSLTLDFAAGPGMPAALRGVEVEVRYELYQGLPAYSKQVTVRRTAAGGVRLTGLVTEQLAVPDDKRELLYLDSDYRYNLVNQRPSDFTQEIAISRGAPPPFQWETANGHSLLRAFYTRGPSDLGKGGPDSVLTEGRAFTGFRAYVLVGDSREPERRGLGIRRMYRVLAPQTTENPIYWHLSGDSPERIRAGVDQSVETGFEMMILTFWSGFDIESGDAAYIARMRDAFAYAESKGIEIGGYWLAASSADGGAAFNVVDPRTGRPGSPWYGQSACLASGYKESRLEGRVMRFLEETRMKVIETDGPYHGDHCAATTHAHHKGLDDSRFAQHKVMSDWYRDLRGRGIYITTPDWYLLNGGNKIAVGYTEASWSLPHWRQILVGRQFLFDGTYIRTPPMSWTFTPLEQYQGGGPAATVEPLSANIKVYEWHLAQNFGSGVQSSWRGSRLYDGPETRALVKKWVDFFKRYRDILNSDILHLKRPEAAPGNPGEGSDLDYILHVNPRLPTKALLMVYNQTSRSQTRTLAVPLYYAGIRGRARIREQEGPPQTLVLDAEHRAALPVSLAPLSITWFVLEDGAGSGIRRKPFAGARKPKEEAYDVRGKRMGRKNPSKTLRLFGKPDLGGERLVDTVGIEPTTR